MGRSHAVRFAQEGADIIAIDLRPSKDLESVPYSLQSNSGLDGLAAEVEALVRSIVTGHADIRNAEAHGEIVDGGVADLGRLDAVVANAAISSFHAISYMPVNAWQDVLTVDLTGTWNTVRAGLPHLRRSGAGAIVLTGSAATIKPSENMSHYVTTKYGLVGLARSLAVELGPENIRVNIIHPSDTNTDMLLNPATVALFTAGLEEGERTDDAIKARYRALNLVPTPWLEAQDISNAVLFLISDDARCVTGIEMPVDAGTN
jgi:(+)-trans-carveol dehydrogenase